MNDKDKDALYNWIDNDVLSPDEIALFKGMSEQERIVFVTERTWQAACAYKDAQLINGSKMKQMNDRIEELKELAKLQADTITRLERENKKLREALKE